jgi:tetratricopeptide (TPR) repeat protein
MSYQRARALSREVPRGSLGTVLPAIFPGCARTIATAAIALLLVSAPRPSADGGEEAPAVPSAPGRSDVNPAKDPRYMEELALVHWKYGWLKEAQEMFIEAAKATRDAAARSKLLVNAGRVAADRRQWEESIRIFREAAEAVPDADGKAECMERIGYVYEKTKRLDEALAVYAEACRLPAGPATLREIRHRIVDVERRRETLDAAVARWAEAAAASPPDANAVELLCLVYMGPRQDCGKAIEYMDRLAALRKLDSDEERRLAAACERAGKYERAVRIYEGLVRSGTAAESDFILERLALSLAALGRKEDALAAASRLTERHPTGVVAQRVAASVYARFGDVAGGAAYLQTCIARTEDAVRRAEIMLLLARFYRDARDYARAEEWTRKAMESKDLSCQIRARRLLIQLYEEQGRLGELKLP